MSSLSLRQLPVGLSSMSGIHSAVKQFSGSSVKKKYYSQDDYSVSYWQCPELPFCFLKFLDASRLHLCFAGTAL